MSDGALTLDGTLMTGELASAATSACPLRLDPAAVAATARNREALVTAIEVGADIYGITTGFGALVSEPVPRERTLDAQVNLLRSHAAGWGPSLPRAIVRGAMIVRLNSLLRARSGIRVETLQRIVDMLNADLVPVVPSRGSLGASGDLAPSAHAFLPLIGEGEVADADGRRLTAAEALRRSGIEPVVLEAKEALALINGTHFMAATGALASARLAAALDTADAAAAAAIEALEGARTALDPRVHELRLLDGQMTSARNIDALIEGTDRHLDPRSVGQDPYSLRCAAQVHGAAREVAAFFERIVAADVNAVTDNPLVFEEPLTVVSAGNFHGQSLAVAFDAARIAIADLASISERRIFRMLSPTLNRGLPPFLSREAGASSGYMVAQYTAAALLAELRALAHPVSCDSVPTSDNQEDHVSMGMTAGLMTSDALDRLESVLAIELVCAAQALDCRSWIPGSGVQAVRDAVREVVPPLGDDRPPAGDIAAAAALVGEGRFAAIVRDDSRLETSA